ncbi:hypothetical protein RhiirC2_739972 [Rhizophagus irregularis]|uniref:Transposase Tc1-like domain-containing protein n=2 Tax=Rhizophagus irregularis TaxID=588596 RepID=A0A2N1NIY3_9GLOM|nr:hypothetical protein RhiirC2_739972 [Rhizophagus irregularis]
MCLGKELTEGQKGGIIAAKKLGHTDSKTAEVVGCSRSSVQRVWKSYESEELSKKRTGRPKTLTESERKLLKRSVIRNKKTRRQTLSQIRLNYVNKTNKTASTQTIRKELAKENLHSRIPRFSPLISEKLLALDVCGVNLPKSFMKTVSQAQSKRVLVGCFGDVFPGLAWVL